MPENFFNNSIKSFLSFAKVLIKASFKTFSSWKKNFVKISLKLRWKKIYNQKLLVKSVALKSLRNVRVSLESNIDEINCLTESWQIKMIKLHFQTNSLFICY